MRTLDIVLVCFTNLFERLHCYALSPLLRPEISRRHLSSTINAIIFYAHCKTQTRLLSLNSQMSLKMSSAIIALLLGYLQLGIRISSIDKAC